MGDGVRRSWGSPDRLVPQVVGEVLKPSSEISNLCGVFLCTSMLVLPTRPGDRSDRHETCLTEKRKTRNVSSLNRFQSLERETQRAARLWPMNTLMFPSLTIVSPSLLRCKQLRMSTHLLLLHCPGLLPR